MKDAAINPPEAIDTDVARADAAERRENIASLVRTNPEYNIAQFDKIGTSTRFMPTFNAMAGLFGPIRFGARGLWSLALLVLIFETLAFVQMSRGLFRDLAADARVRIASIKGTLALREQQLAAAIECGPARVDVYQRTLDSLQAVIGGIRDEANVLAAQGIWIALGGLFLLVIANGAQAIVANWALEGRFSDWVSDRTIRLGMPMAHIVLCAVFLILIVGIAMVHYSFPGRFALLSYMGLLGFWEKAVTTLALLGTAACLSILIGIPLGMLCARHLRFYSFIQPIMDFMQTMPAFVFLIPVIAFFGAGKPAGLIFRGTRWCA